MKENNIELIFGLLIIVATAITIVSMWIYIDNTINNLSEEDAEIVYNEARDGTLVRNWAMIFFPTAFAIALIVSYKRKKKPGVIV